MFVSNNNKNKELKYIECLKLIFTFGKVEVNIQINSFLSNKK